MIKQKKRDQLPSLSVSQAGFTFVEIITSLALISLATIITAGSFVAAINLERRSAAHRAVQQNAAHLFQYLGKAVRNGEFNYDAYGGTLPNQSSTLNLFFREYEESIFLQSGTIRITRDGVTSDFTDNNVIVEVLDFYLSPNTKCIETSTSCSQQRVTVALRLRSNTAEIFEPVVASFQSTFSVRLYDI